MKKILSLTLVVVMLMSAFVYAQASTLRDGGARTAAESAASDRTHADSKEDAKVVSTAEPCDSAKQLPQDDINMRENPSEESSAEEPYIVKVYDANDCVDIHTAVNNKGGLYESHAFLKTHYLMSDGTWRIGESYAKGQWYDKPYKYRYILSSGEASDETAIVLSNRPDLTYVDGLRLIYGSDLNYKYSLEAIVVAYNFGDKTVAWAEMQDQVPAHCVSLSHGEQQ